MLTLLALAASAGTLLVDANVPVQIGQNGSLIAELFQAAELRVELPAGPQKLTFYVDGKPQPVEIEIPETGAAEVVVGKTGITTWRITAEAVVPAGPVRVELRVSGVQGVMVVLDDRRHQLSPGDVLSIELPAGDHKIGVRAPDGTVIWARGTLDLVGRAEGPVVVQFAEGHVPEVGEGGSYRPDGS